MRRFLVVLVLSAAVQVPAGAVAAPPPVGTPVQLSAPTACWADSALAGCTADPFGSFLRPMSIDISPGGLDVYVANQSADLGHFRRNPATNVLTPAGSINVGGSSSLQGVIVSPDGGRVFAARGGTSGEGRVTAFTRDPSTGALAHFGCADEEAALGCVNVAGIGGANQVAVPASGPGVYVAAPQGGADGPDMNPTPDGAIVALAVGPTGTFSQLDCIPRIDAAPCASAPADEPVAQGTESVAVAPGGAHVYFGTFAGLVGYNRDPATGALASKAECLLRNTGLPLCPEEERLPIGERIVFSPDGEFLYVSGDNTLTVFDRNTQSGALTFVECFKKSGSAGPCPVLAGWSGGSGLAMSPDAGVVYTAAGGFGAGQVEAFRRDPATGRLARFACLGVSATPTCGTGAGLLRAQAVEATDDGRGLFVGSYEGTGDGDNGALAAFRIEAAPACQGAAVSVAAGGSVSLPLPCSDPDGDPLTRQIAGGPAKGSLGAIDQAAGSVVYSAPATASGADSVGFIATDGTNASAPATVTISITPGGSGGDKTAPRSRIGAVPRAIRAGLVGRFRGTAADPGGQVRRVQIAVVRLEGGAKTSARRRASCRVLTKRGTLRKRAARRGRCRAQGFLAAKGAVRWSYKLRRPLALGRYVVYSRAVDAAGNAERTFSKRRGNLRTFRVR